MWLGAVVGSFGVLESIGLAARNKDPGLPPDNSLSQVFARWFRVVPGQPVSHWTLPHVLALIALTALALVLIGHLGFGLWLAVRSRG